jgi:hypothetical protein
MVRFQQMFNNPKYGRKDQDTTNCVIHSFVRYINFASSL